MKRIPILLIFISIFFVIPELFYRYSDCSKMDINIYISLLWILGGIISSIYFISRGYHNKVLEMGVFYRIFIMALLLFIGNILYYNLSVKLQNPGVSRCLLTGATILLLTLGSIYITKNGLRNIDIFAMLMILLGSIILII